MPDLLPLERIAALRAELDVTDRPDDVLAREALTRSAWSAGLESLLAELADEVDRGESTRAGRRNNLVVPVCYTAPWLNGSWF